MSRRFASSLEIGSARAGYLPAALRPFGIVLAGSLAVALAAHVSVPLGFTAVPLTLQPMAVLLVGLLAGPTLGFATLCLYLLEGAAGLPVFSPAGPGGILQLAGPTGGFLIAYPFVAALAGFVQRRVPLASRYWSAVVAGAAGVALLYIVGASRFAAVMHSGLRATLVGATLPFLPGEILKIFAAAGIASALGQRHPRPIKSR